MNDRYFAHWRESSQPGRYADINMYRWQVELYGAGPIVPVVVRETGGPGPYWAWVPTGSDQYELIWPALGLLDMCFPYGVRAAESAGRGRVCCVTVEGGEP